ncbi:5018_t:CDS:1, partial [Paraglomus occultum]
KEHDQVVQNTLYKMYPNAVVCSELINTRQIAQLFQESEEQALKEEIKKIEQEIDQTLTDELRNLVSDFIQARKKMVKSESYEEAKKESEKLEDQLLDEKGLMEENIEKIIDYCKRLAVEQEKLQANVEINTNK